MMRLLIISDIHGSKFYLDKILHIYRKGNFNKLVILGDILYHGPRNDLPKSYNPKDVIVSLNSIKDDILAIRGNCDAEVDQMVLDFPIMADYSTILYDGRIIYLTHGHVYNEDKLPPLRAGDILMYGHTHVPMIKEKEGNIFINPGSISIPKSEFGNTYAELDGNLITIKTLNEEIIYSIKI
ncbi:MAG: yfcE2 [Clostridiales bacterium]|jgi:putative phosphoesterase|nr:yfcE2 [Clostridiales bacterium]